MSSIIQVMFAAMLLLSWAIPVRAQAATTDAPASYMFVRINVTNLQAPLEHGDAFQAIAFAVPDVGATVKAIADAGYEISQQPLSIVRANQTIWPFTNRKFKACK